MEVFEQGRDSIRYGGRVRARQADGAVWEPRRMCGYEVEGEGGTEPRWGLRAFPLYPSSSYFQSCHHLQLLVLGKAPSHPGPQPLCLGSRQPHLPPQTLQPLADILFP